MSCLPAVFSFGKIYTGCNHGDAYHKASDKSDDIVVSGYLNQDGSFTSELNYCRKSLIIIRHSESLFNTGTTKNHDSDLSPKGAGQGEKTAKYLSEKIKGYVGYTSPFLRCLKTSMALHNLGIPFTVDPRIGEITATFPDEGVKIVNRQSQYRTYNWERMDGDILYNREPCQDFIGRLSSFLADAPEKAIVVTHGSCVLALVELALGAKIEHMPCWDGRVGNASVSHVASGTLIHMAKTIS